MNVKVHVFQLGSLEVGVEAEAEGHVGVALVNDGHVDGGSVAVQIVVHQHSKIEGVEELGQRGGLQNQGHTVRADAFHIPCAQVGKAMVLHGVCLAVKEMHAVIGQAAVGEQHRHAEAGAVALGEVGVAGPDVLLAVQREAGDHAAALRGDDQLGLCLCIGDDILLVAGTVFGDVTGGDLIHGSVLLMLLVFGQFFKIIINAIADEIFNNAYNNANHRRIKQQRKQQCTICTHQIEHFPSVFMHKKAAGRREPLSSLYFVTERRRP